MRGRSRLRALDARRARVGRCGARGETDDVQIRGRDECEVAKFVRAREDNLGVPSRSRRDCEGRAHAARDRTRAMSGAVVVEEMYSGSLHVMHSSAQMAVFLTFAIVGATWAWAETLHARTHRGAKRDADAEMSELPVAASAGFAGDKDKESLLHAAAPAGPKDSAPVATTDGPILDLRRIRDLSPVRIALGDKSALLASRTLLRAWAEFGMILAIFYFADRTGAIPDSEKRYDRDLFLALFLSLGGYGWWTTLSKSKSHAPLNREQTEEWKGWMQVLFLLYHYFKAAEMYNAIRLFIAAYVWMTGFGNFSYYYVRKDFGVPRFMQMMWRLNFFVFFACLVMRNDYTLYYICPMHTLFTLFVYFSLLVYKDHNDKTPVLLVKVAFCLAFVYVLWEVPGVFRLVFRPFQFLLGYVDPKKPGSDPMHEWFFRSGLDRYVWIHGMVCAFFHPRYEAALRWIDEQPAASRVAIQTAVAVATLGVLRWYHGAYYVLPKLEYNKVHPYTSWIPITCFIILRNLTQTLRNWYIELFCVCGKITLETYISQFHVWLSTENVPNGQPGKLMELIPKYPLVNFGVATLVYVGISQRVFALTNELKTACVPNDPRRIATHAAFALAWFSAATVAGFVVVHVFMLEPIA